MVGILLVILACLFWGVDTLIRYPLVETGIDPVTIVFFEHLVLVLIFSTGLFGSFRRLGGLKLADLFSFFLVGGLGSAIATVAFTESFHFLNPSLVILLQKFQPVVAIVLARVVLQEQVQRQFVLWALVCLSGGLLVSAPDIARFYQLLVSDYNLVVSDGALKGYALATISIFGWAGATVFGKRLSLQGFDTRTIMGGRFLLGLVVLVPFVSWGRSLLLPAGLDYVRILVMVLLSGALAMWFYYQGLRRISARATAIAEMFFPFFAIVLNWYFLNKQLTELQLLGGAILVAGALVIQIKKY